MSLLDLDGLQAIINRPHIVDLRDDGWTLMHPPACHPNLFACQVTQAATRNLEERPPQAPGWYFCEFDPDGVDWGFVIGDPAGEVEGIDWNALVAELRAAREVIEATRDHDCSTRWRQPCGHQFKALAIYDQVTREVPR